MELPIEKHPPYNPQTLVLRLKQLISDPFLDCYHDFSASNYSDLQKWGLVNNQGIFKYKIKRTPKMDTLIKLLEKPHGYIEQKSQYQLLYALDILQKNTMPEKILILTKIMSSNRQLAQTKTIYTARWVCQLQIEDDAEAQKP